MLIYTLLASVVLLELLVHILSPIAWLRKIVASAAVILGAFAAGVLAVSWFNVFTVLIAFLSLYRALNMLRVVQQRMHERYLRRTTSRTTLILVGAQLLVAGGWMAWEQWHANGYLVWGVVGLVQATVALILILSTRRNLRKTIWPTVKQHYSDRELPTITVAIPARNETEDLQQCLQSILASDYPKLEVIVLDDCSQTKRTPEIIKAFAQSGVRFIRGQEPSATWLPKNQVYDRLTKEASGEYLLFCGVDVRFESQSLRQLITVLVNRHKQMLCVLPRRQNMAYGRLSVIQAMRYWWELALPRRTFNRPPVLSSCWIIKQTALKELGGFRSVARAITPEAHFARELTKTDGYSFLRSTDGLGITSTKPVAEQRATAVRMRYPQMHRRPEQVVLIAVGETVFLLLPFVMAIGGFWWPIGIVAHISAGAASIMLIVVYEIVVRNTRVNNRWFGLIGQPLAALMDIVLLHYSMWKYEFSTVDWKGRNVCIPVMHVVPHLPKLSSRENIPKS